LVNDNEIEEASERFKAMCFLPRSDDSRYGELLSNLKKGVFLGRDEYSPTVMDAYQLLLRTSKEGIPRRQYGRFNRQRNNQPNSQQRSSFNLAQKAEDKSSDKKKEESVPEKNGDIFEHITCYACHKMGHYSDQ